MMGAFGCAMAVGYSATTCLLRRSLAFLTVNNDLRSSQFEKWATVVPAKTLDPQGFWLSQLAEKAVELNDLYLEIKQAENLQRVMATNTHSH
ncbi:MAG: hypothetical protein WAK84_08260 [Candidatus Cybelea sp.]